MRHAAEIKSYDFEQRFLDQKLLTTFLARPIQISSPVSRIGTILSISKADPCQKKTWECDRAIKKEFGIVISPEVYDAKSRLLVWPAEPNTYDRSPFDVPDSDQMDALELAKRLCNEGVLEDDDRSDSRI